MTTELDTLDAGTSGSSLALASGDSLIVGDASASNETKKVLMSDVTTFIGRPGVIDHDDDGTLTLAQTGSYVIWSDGTLTLPASATVGTQFTIFNNCGSSKTVALGTNNSMLSGWASNAAVADHDATTYVCVSSTNWVQVGA